MYHVGVMKLGVGEGLVWWQGRGRGWESCGGDRGGGVGWWCVVEGGSFLCFCRLESFFKNIFFSPLVIFSLPSPFLSFSFILPISHFLLISPIVLLFISSFFSFPSPPPLLSLFYFNFDLRMLTRQDDPGSPAN